MTLIERKVVAPQRARCCSRFSLLLTTSQPLPLNVGPPSHVSAEPRPSFFTVAPGRPCTYPAEPFSNRTAQKKGRKTFFASVTVSYVVYTVVVVQSLTPTVLQPKDQTWYRRGYRLRYRSWYRLQYRLWYRLRYHSWYRQQNRKGYRLYGTGSRYRKWYRLWYRLWYHVPHLYTHPELM